MNTTDFILKKLYGSCFFDFKKEELLDLMKNHSESLMIAFKISTSSLFYQGSRWENEEDYQSHCDFLEKVGAEMPYLESKHRGSLSITEDLNKTNTLFGMSRVYSHPDDLHLTVPLSVFEEMVSAYRKIDSRISGIMITNIYDSVKVEEKEKFFEMLKPTILKTFIDQAKRMKGKSYYDLNGYLYSFEKYGDDHTKTRNREMVGHFKDLCLMSRDYINELQKTEAFDERITDKGTFFKLKSDSRLKKLKKAIKVDLNKKYCFNI